MSYHADQACSHPADPLTTPLPDSSLPPQVKNLEWEAEVLAQRFTKVQAERDELYERFEVRRERGFLSVLQLAGVGCAYSCGPMLLLCLFGTRMRA